MSEGSPRQRVYGLVARIGKAADSPRRLELLEVLAQGPRTVESLAHETALSVANASRHLQVLRQAGLVEGRRQGLYVEYRLSGPEVFDLLQLLRTIAERRSATWTGSSERRVSATELLSVVPEVAASAGSACHAGQEQASAVILALGIAPEVAVGTVRLTLGRGSTEDEVRRAAPALAAGWRGLSGHPL